MRVTKKDLQNVLNRINDCLGLPREPHYRDANGNWIVNVGTFTLCNAPVYGGWRLERMHKSGGVSTVTSRHRPKEMLAVLQALEIGLEMGKAAAK